MGQPTDMEGHVRQVSTILLISTLLSYTPQYHRLRSHCDSWGISLWYLALNAIACTEQFAVYLNLFIPTPVSGEDPENTILKNAISTEDYFNLAQLGVMWVCSSVLFFRSIRYNSPAPATKAFALIAYIAWFAISVGAVGYGLFMDLLETAITPDGRKYFLEIVQTWHSTVFNPVATLFIALSIVPQTSEVLRHGSRGSLSIPTLCYQTLVFAALTCSWRERFPIPDKDLPEDPHTRITVWYNDGGWAMVDSALFAVVQGLLLLLALLAICMRPRRKEKAKAKPKPKPKPKPKTKTKQRFLWGRRVNAKSKAKSPERSPLLPRFTKTDGK